MNIPNNNTFLYTVEELGIDNLRIYQPKDGYHFAMDSVLLADFTRQEKDASAIDLCTGSAVIPLLLYGRRRFKNYVAVEILEDIACMAKDSIKLNKLENKINIICDDINNLNITNNVGVFDVVTVNPPFFEACDGIMPKNINKAISKYEIKINLEDLAKIANRLLKNTGVFYLVHRCERLSDVLNLLSKHSIEPKRLRFVYPSINKNPKIFLLEGIKNAKKGLTVERPLIVFNNDNTYTRELKNIYNIGE